MYRESEFHHFKSCSRPATGRQVLFPLEKTQTDTFLLQNVIRTQKVAHLSLQQLLHRLIVQVVVLERNECSNGEGTQRVVHT